MLSKTDGVFRIRHVDRALLAAERERTLALLSTCVDSRFVSEVGSTAIEGLIGKGDIDLLVLVPADEFETTRDRIDRLFERNSEQLSSQEFQGYRVPSTIDVSVQLTVQGGTYDVFHSFLDALRRSPQLRGEYNTLKCRFDGRCMDQYRAAKQRFIESVLATSAASHPQVRSLDAEMRSVSCGRSAGHHSSSPPQGWTSG